MTRYAFMKRPKGVWDVSKHNDGPWMLFEDHAKITSEQRALIEQQAREMARLRKALRELHAQVQGECPSLLNEDSGGDAANAVVALVTKRVIPVWR